MKTVSISDVDSHLDAYIKKTRKEPIIITSNGRPIAALLSVQDSEDIERILAGIGENKEKKRISQVNESLGLVTAEVAHKVGNAAGAIRVIAREYLQNSSNLTEEQVNGVQIILRNAEEMIRATEDLFKPFWEEPKAEVTVEEMIRVATAQCVIPENIRLSITVASGLPKVYVQVTKVQSYLVELLNNAIKYATKGRINKGLNQDTIEIDSKHDNDGFVEILFTNHGPSIPSDRWESIFRVFSAEKKKSQDEPGYGLGLWGARATMRQQGGDVLLRESNDARTTFVVRLPSVHTDTQEPTNKKNILHLEDDSEWNNIVRSALSGYDVHSAH